MRQYEGGGVIEPNYPDIIDLSKNEVSIYMLVDCIEKESQEYQGQAEGGGVMVPKNGTITYLSVPTESVLMSVDTTVDESV